MKNTEMTLRKDRRILAVLASGKYTVTRDGRVFDNDRQGAVARGQVVEMVLRKDKNGYFDVYLSGVGTCRRARLMAIAFLGVPPEEGMQVNHKNGIKDDDRPENIEWVTPKQNIQHALNTGLKVQAHGESHGSSKLSEGDVKEIKALLARGGVSLKKIGEKFGVSAGAVNGIKRGLNWKRVSNNG